MVDIISGRGNAGRGGGRERWSKRVRRLVEEVGLVDGVRDWGALELEDLVEQRRRHGRQYRQRRRRRLWA